MTASQYDQLNRISSQVVDPGGLAITTRFGYKAGAIATAYTVAPSTDTTFAYVQDPNGNVTVKVYDRHNRLLFSKDTLGNATRYTYNGAGYLSGKTCPTGDTSPTPLTVEEEYRAKGADHRRYELCL